MSSSGDHGVTKSPLSKPIRRRSRASKKTPTTVLNANENNFRSLVQQFTGRRRPQSAAFPLAAHRGPVNLNFSNYREEDSQVAAQYSDSNYGYAFHDQMPAQLRRNSSDQGVGSGVSSFNSQSTVSSFDGGLVFGLGESSVAPPEGFDPFPVEDFLDLVRVSEGLSYASRDFW